MNGKKTGLSGFMQGLLLLAMGLSGLCCLLTAGNTLLSPWTLYGRSKPLLCLLTALALAAMLLAFRWADGHHAFFAAHERAFLAGAAAFMFVCQMLLAAALRFTPITDVEQCFTAAEILADGGALASYERAWVYFTRYPHNMGIVYLLAGIFRFFGVFGWSDRLMQAGLVCSLMFIPGLLAGARVARRIGGTRAEARFLLLLPTCLPLLYCTTEIYTDAFALSFAAVIVWCAFRAREAEGMPRRILWLLLIAALAFLGAQIRFTSVIAAIACLIWLCFDGTLPLGGVGAALLMVVFLLGGSGMDAANARVFPKEDIEKNRLPKLHYIAMGLPVHEDEGYGDYGYGGWLIFSTSFDDPAERDAALLQKVIDKIYYLRYPDRMANMLSRKFLCDFGDGTFGFGDMIAADEKTPDNAVKQIVFPDGALNRGYYALCTALLCAQLLLAALAACQAILRRETKGAALLLCILGAMLFLCFWEARARYFFQFMEILLCAGAMTEGRKKA